MKYFLTFILCFITFSFVIASFDKDMKYHNKPYSYVNFSHHKAYACYFKLSDFGIIGYDYKIKIIGFIGYSADNPADIYVTSKEKDGLPVCNPDNNWEGADYGPKSWHINNSYPNYDDCNLYDDNWHYSKYIDKFWCMYYVKSYPSPDPLATDYSEPKNSFTFWSHCWTKGTYSVYRDWCMHCVIVYWGADIENTSLGVVKALFK